MKLLITGAWRQAKDYIKIIEQMGHQVIFLQYEKDELPCVPEWIEGVICNGLFLEHSIEQFTNLKYIQLTSAGFDRVPMDYIKEHGIQIRNARGVYSIPMAEFAICGVLQLYKQASFFMKKKQEHSWEKHRELRELYGKNVCIVGCGSVGSECAKRFKAFGCTVTGVDLFSREDENYQEIVGFAELDTALSKADIVVLTLPLTEETYHLLDADKIKILQDGVVLVNIARGAVVDTEALLQNVGRLGGAVLDVFEEEPLEEKNLLWDRENVILTPHNSFVGEGNSSRLSELIIKNLKG